jgi:hypothetical protein
MPAQFNDVKTVLDKIITDWTAGNGAPPDFVGARTHNSATFGWATKQQLLNSSARGIQLIQPAIIGKPNLGPTANLVIALTTGVKPFPPMPFGGLDSQNGQFLTIGSPQIQTIISWIEGGCQDTMQPDQSV